MANPNGKKGSQKHQDVQKAEKVKLEKEFKNISVEPKIYGGLPEQQSPRACSGFLSVTDIEYSIVKRFARF